MANVIFKQGTGTPTTYKEGALYFSTDKKVISLGLTGGAHVDFIDIEVLATAPTDTTGMQAGKLYIFEGKAYFANGNTLVTIGDTNALQAAINTLNGADTVTGSVAKAVKDASDALKGDATNDTKDSVTIEGAKKYADDKVTTAGSYEIEVATTSTGASKSYKLVKIVGSGESQTKTDAGVVIDIPKDMVVSSGTVETYTDDTKPADVTDAGTYLVLTLANATSDKVYINVGNLIEYVTSGSAANDQIVVAISADHKITATISNGTVTKANLVQDVQNTLDNVQKIYGTTTIPTDGSQLTLEKLNDAIKAGGTEWGTFDEVSGS